MPGDQLILITQPPGEPLMPERLTPEIIDAIGEKAGQELFKLRMSEDHKWRRNDVGPQGPAGPVGPIGSFQRWSPLIFSLTTGVILLLLGWTGTLIKESSALQQSMREDILSIKNNVTQNSKDVSRLDGSQTQFQSRLEQSQAQRIQNDREQAQRSSTLENRMVVIETKQDAAQDTLATILRELKEARREGNVPFRENRLKTRRRPPFILKTIYEPIPDVAQILLAVD